MHALVDGEKPRRARRPLLALSLPSWEGVLAVALLVVAWEWAARHSTPMFFPPLRQIAAAAVELLGTTEGWEAVLITCVRILVYLAGSFVASSLLGLLAAWNRHVERFLLPLIELKQGIPAVCWVLFAILWFKDAEARIAFVVVTSALPSFFYQARDALRGIPRDLIDMVRALRPGYLQTVRILLWPAVLPSLLTVWRINLGNATRITIMAELLGGMTGLGHQLRLSQELFRMDQTIVWTGILVLFVMLGNQVLSALERRYLAWRADEGVRSHA